MTDAWGQSGESTGAVLCPQGHANSSSYRFCSQCGSPIGVVPFPADDDLPEEPPPTRRRIGPIVGAVATVVVLVAGAIGAYLLVGGAGDATSSQPVAGGFGTGATAATPTAVVCHEAPIVEAESFDMTDEGITVGALFSPGCPGGDVEAGAAVRVTVADGQRDIAAGEFDFSAAPMEMKVGVPARRTLVFPPGMYWRTPDMVGNQPQLVAHRPDRRSATPVASKSATGPMVATAVAEPEHGSVDGVAKAVLGELRDNDYPVLRDAAFNRWVPQVSSKRAGLVVDGRTFTNADVLRDHLDFRQRFDTARLLYSGQWSTFNDTDWWVTVVGSVVVLPAGRQRLVRSAGFRGRRLFREVRQLDVRS